MKKKTLIKALSILLTGVMLIGMTGCKKDGNGNNPFNHGSTNKKQAAADAEAAKQGVFTYDKINISGSENGYNQFYEIGKLGNEVVVLYSVYDYQTNFTIPYVASLDLNGNLQSDTELKMPDLTKYLPENYEEIKAAVEAANGGENIGGEDSPILYEEPVPEENTTEESVEAPVEETTEETTEEVVEEDVIDDEEYYFNDTYWWENNYFNRFVLLDDCIVGVMEYDYNYSYDGQEGYCSKMLVCGWGYDGSCKWDVDLNQELNSDNVYANFMFHVDNEVILYTEGYSNEGGSANKVIYIGSTGTVYQKKDIPEGGNTITNVVTLRNGKAVAFYYDANYNSGCGYFNPETLAISEKIDIPAGVMNSGYSIQAGVDTDFMFANTYGLYTYNIGDEDVKEYMNCINSDLDGYAVNIFTMIDSETFVGAYSDSNYDTCLAFFRHVDPATIPDKKVVTMAVYWVNGDVRQRIIDFNKTNPNYRIMIKDYSQYATDDDWTAGYTRLNNDILSGNVPDIIYVDLGNMDLTSYAKKGLLVNLDDLIAQDEELSQNSYLTNVFDAFAVNGKHYMIIPSFNYSGFLAGKRFVGDKSSWTVSECVEFMKNAPAGTTLMEYPSRDSFISTVMSIDGSEFIDPQTGKCDFQSDDFITFLEYAAKLPAEPNWDDDEYYSDYSTKFRSGKVILMNTYIYNLQDIQMANYQYFDGEGVLIGFPSRNGASGIITCSTTPCVIAKGACTEGAWEFERYYLTAEYQDSLQYDIPVLESSFDKWAAKGLERPYWEDENGNRNYYDNTYYIDGIEYTVPVMTQEEVDYYVNIIKNCKKTWYNNQQITSIIEEEASACFTGQKSASEVAAVIQSRVQLYINENE